MIYTLDYLKKEAGEIVGSWNGEDEKFTDAHGETRTEEDVHTAEDLLTKISEIQELAKILGV